jgi:hypothetical protein
MKTLFPPEVMLAPARLPIRRLKLLEMVSFPASPTMRFVKFET